MPRPTLRSVAIAAIAVTAALAAALSAGSAAAKPIDPGTEPVGAGRIVGADRAGVIADRYVVVLKPGAKLKHARGVEGVAASLAKSYAGYVRHVYDSALNGFSVTMTKGQAEKLANHADVAYVEQAFTVSVTDTQNNPPNWGDDRVDQANLPLNQQFVYPANPGQGATVYVLDTGLNPNHVDFTGRVGSGTDMVDNDSNPADCHGHGTHVSGTAVGTTYGIAKKARVVAVRVLNCQGSGSNDDIIAGINWVRTNAQKPAVVNYSIGCGSRCSDQALDSAVSSLISSGVQWVQAAGNNGDDACYYSPQSLAAAITVGNTQSSDARNSSSNYGSCLDIFAPGTSIVSASYSSNTGSATMTGTSMASPHVAGAAAVYLGQNPSATPAQVRDALATNATSGKVTSPGSGSPNRLLYTAFMNGTNPPPTNDFSVSVNPTSGSVAPGNSITATVGTAVVSGSAVTVALSASGLPTGATASFSPSSVTAGNSSTLTLTAGTNTAAGTYPVTITGTSGSTSRTATYNLTVTGSNPAGPTVTHPGNRTGTVGTAVSLQLQATGGTTPYTWSVSGLPNGLSASSSGLISGTPSAAGSYTVTATVTDANNRTDSEQFGWTISAPPTGGLTNGGFEAGSTSGWSATGVTGVSTSPVRSGAYSGRIGSTSAYNTTSALTQTFTASRSQLSLYTRLSCSSFGFGVLTINLTDNTTGATSQIGFRFCGFAPAWQATTASLVVGRGYTLSISLADSTFSGGATVVNVDDVLG